MPKTFVTRAWFLPAASGLGLSRYGLPLPVAFGDRARPKKQANAAEGKQVIAAEGKQVIAAEGKQVIAAEGKQVIAAEG